MKFYFDGSVGGENNRWMTLGGISATDAAWAKLESAWEKMLVNRDPPAKYLHMTDLITGNKAFTRKAGWDKQKAQRLVWDAIHVLKSVGNTTLCAFSGSIDTQAHAKLCNEGYKLQKPAVICAELAIGALFLWHVEQHGLDLAYLFFDQNEPYIKSFRTRWLKLNKPGKFTPELFWGSIANVQPVSMIHTPQIQMADLVAWASTRRLRGIEGEDWCHLADILIGSRERNGVISARQIDPINETILRRYNNNRMPVLGH